MAASCRVWRQTCLGKGVWGAVPIGGSDECKAADVGSWWQPVACTQPVQLGVDGTSRCACSFPRGPLLLVCEWRFREILRERM